MSEKEELIVRHRFGEEQGDDGDSIIDDIGDGLACLFGYWIFVLICWGFFYICMAALGLNNPEVTQETVGEGQRHAQCALFGFGLYLLSFYLYFKEWIGWLISLVLFHGACFAVLSQWYI